MKRSRMLGVSEAFASESNEFHQQQADYIADRDEALTGFRRIGPAQWQIARRIPELPPTPGEHPGPAFVVTWEVDAVGGGSLRKDAAR